MDPKGLRVTQSAYFSLLTHTKELLLVTFLLVTFCETTAGNGASFRRHGRRQTERQTDVEVEIVI